MKALALIGFVLILVAALLFFARSPTMNVMPGKEPMARTSFEPKDKARLKRGTSDVASRGSRNAVELR